MNTARVDLTEVRLAVERLSEAFDSLLMATADREGAPVCFNRQGMFPGLRIFPSRSLSD
ncbi:MAG: hypothetical protein ACRERU_03765 [Methylococcales bacterium]